MNIRINFDGSCHNASKGGSNPMGVGVAVFIDEVYDDGLSNHYFYPVQELSEGERGTNNAAEWLGCVQAFKMAKYLLENLSGLVYNVTIQSDSQVITFQYNGDYRISNSNPYFHHYYKEAKEIAKECGLSELKIKQIPRELNKEADKLSKITKEEKESIK